MPLTIDNRELYRLVERNGGKVGLNLVKPKADKSECSISNASLWSNAQQKGKRHGTPVDRPVDRA
jgi:hypothetical protein